MSNRKAFNFFRSYYEVAKELSNNDRLAFYDALILEQFTGLKTELKGMAKFAYISQSHSISSQITGFNQRLKRNDTDLLPLSNQPPAIGANEGVKEGAAVQEEEKGEEKGKELTLERRKLKFASTLKPYLETYGKDFLNDFYLYWTEPNKTKTQFRQELERTWDLNRRLKKWASYDKDFSKKDKPNETDQEYKVRMLRERGFAV